MGAKSGQNKNLAGVKRLALVLFGALFALLFVLFAVAEGIGEPSVPAGDVALVQDVSSDVGHISEKKFEHALDLQVAGAGLKKAPKPGSKKYEELKTSVMTELIEATWLVGEAENLGITVTEKQIETELANIKKQNFPTEKAFQEFLKTSHYTKADVHEKVELQVLGAKVQQQINSGAAPPTNAEIQAYYDENKATQYTEPTSRDIRVVVNKEESKVEKAKEALEADNSPASWKKVATKYSEDPTAAETGGLQKGITEELLQGALKKAVFGSATGELVGPIKYQGNSLLIEVVKLNPEKVKSLGEVRSQISQTLTQQKQQEHFTEFLSGYRAGWRSRTFCASGFEVEACSNYPESETIAKAREANKACYEANPKKAPTECPAPVEQTKPAVPGTVTPFKPGGEQLVQRPQPEVAPAGGSASETPEGAEGTPEAAPESGGGKATPEGESGK